MQPYGRLRTVLIRDTSKGHEKEGEDNEEKIRKFGFNDYEKIRAVENITGLRV